MEAAIRRSRKRAGLKRIHKGDILLLTYEQGSILAQVTKIREGGTWEAQQVLSLYGYEFREDCAWFGPDPKSWKSVTNLGPCIPAPEVPDGSV